MISIKNYILQIKIVGIKELYNITKAKKSYLNTHKECSVCGSVKSLEIHHIKPVHLYPDLATNSTNFITLCDVNNQSCHRWFGHFGDFKTKWNPYIREFAILTRLLNQKCDINRKYILNINDLIKEYAQSLNITDEEFLNNIKKLLN